MTNNKVQLMAQMHCIQPAYKETNRIVSVKKGRSTRFFFYFEMFDNLEV